MLSRALGGWRRRRQNLSELSFTAEAPHAVETALRCAASRVTGRVRLVQVCYVDHTVDATTPHIHIQVLFSDRSRTPWITCPEGTVEDLHAAIAMLPNGHSIRLHLHEMEGTGMRGEPPNGGPASEATCSALPRLTLTEISASRLAHDGFDCCPLCLDAMDKAQEVTFIGCPGAHVAHTACISRWLVVASTCPTCRFLLPKDADAEAIADFTKPAELQKMRVEAGEPPPCQITEDSDEAHEQPAQEARAREEWAAAPAVAEVAGRHSRGEDTLLPPLRFRSPPWAPSAEQTTPAGTGGGSRRAPSMEPSPLGRIFSWGSSAR